MVGLTFMRHVLGSGPLASAPTEEAIRVVGPVARAVLAADTDGRAIDR